MNAGTGVFVLKDEATLVSMRAAHFASEDDFQRLLAAFPELLAGDQIDPEAPRRFMLVAREQGIPDEEGRGARWSLDHLFIDQDGIPTLVEVKRGTDTRIRREVVGQMLDYAANSILHWPVEELRSRYEARYDAEGRDPGTSLSEFIGPDSDAESFWMQVSTNLQAGRIRLLFVADRIPPELRRVVEFLNRQMQPAEVLAIELRQFEGQGLKTLVPIVLGHQELTAAKRGGVARAKQGRLWDEESLLAEIDRRTEGNQDVATLARSLVEWAHRRADAVQLNDNPAWCSLTPEFRVGMETVPGPFRLWSDGSLTIPFQYMLDRPVFRDPERREELRQRLNAVPGVSLPEGISKRPTMKLAAVAPAGSAALIAAFDWYADTMRLQAATLLGASS